MNLAYLTRSRIPSRDANAIHVMKMAQAFSRLAWKVTLLAPDFREGLETGVEDVHAFYGVEPSFAVERRPWPNIKGKVWLYGWSAARAAQRLGANRAFGRCLHSCAIAARLGIPTVWDAHMPTALERRRERALLRWMIRAPAFRHMTTNCEALKREFVRAIPELDGRIIAAHNGADPVPADARPADLGETGGRLQVGYVGHLYPGKGFETVRAMAALAPWAVFHVAGGDRATLDALARDTALPANIRLHGFVPPAEAERLVLACDVLLAPYQREVATVGGGETAAWMSPLKVFAYMAAGKPILCSDLPVLREVMNDGENGLLLPPNDAGAWVAALACLAADPVRRAQLGRAAQEDFLARHTWEGRARLVLGPANPS